TAVPGIEITNHRYALGIGCPHRKTHTLHTFMTRKLCAEDLPQFAVIAFGKKVKVGFAQQRPERVGIFSFMNPAVPADTVVIAYAALERQGKQARCQMLRHMSARSAGFTINCPHRQRAREIGAQNISSAASMRFKVVSMESEIGKGVAMIGPDQGFNVTALVRRH